MPPTSGRATATARRMRRWGRLPYRAGRRTASSTAAPSTADRDRVEMVPETGRRGAGFTTLLGSAAVLTAAVASLAGCMGAPSSAVAPASAGPAALADRLPATAAGFRRGEARPAAGGADRGREVAYATGGGRS